MNSNKIENSRKVALSTISVVAGVVPSTTTMPTLYALTGYGMGIFKGQAVIKH